MITSPQAWVTPERELARLTLISPSNEAAIRRRSTITAARFGSLGEINGAPILGPLGPPQPPMTGNKATRQIEGAGTLGSEASKAMKDTTMSDVDSEATLVSDSIKQEGQGLPANDEVHASSLPNAVMPEPEYAGATEPGDQKQAEQPEPIGPPNRPPPVPPRPDSEAEKQKQLQEEVEIGAQQDVTEVINNVLFQSQCAIKPTAFAADGEQLDIIKE